MTTRLAAGVVALLLGAACGKSEAPVDGGHDAGGPLDAGVTPVCLEDRLDAGADDAGWDGGLDFSCRGQPTARGGQAELVIGGKTTKAGLNRALLPGVRLELLSRSGAVLATATSAEDGGYELRFDAGCEPLDGEVRATVDDVRDAGFFPSYAVPVAPWRYDRGGLELSLFDASTRGLVAAVASVTLQPSTAALALTVEDCAGHPVPGATLAINLDGGVVRYVGASGLPTMQLASTGATGEAVLFNLAGDSVEVTATLGGEVVSRRVVPLHVDAITGTTLAP
ncbi:MAG: hypothetical protein ACOZQL_19275 [Myxococcota bacterium]